MDAWRSINQPDSGYPHAIDEALKRAQIRRSDLLWNTKNNIQVLASDYSGQHRDASHQVYSFVITTEKDLRDWLVLRSEFRLKWLPDGRRISFKQLREPMRRRAYPYFLELVGHMKANLIVFMVDQRVGSFMFGEAAATRKTFPDCFDPKSSDGNVEKIFRLATFVSLLAAGLRSEDQPSWWLSDHDETLDSFDRREGFARLAAYLTFGLTRWNKPGDQYFLTTEHDDLPDWGEDLAAIPDLAAGAYAKLSSTLPCFLNQPSWVVRTRPALNLDWRANIFANWLSHSCKVMRHVLVRLEPDTFGEVLASAQSFVYTTGNWRPKS